MEAHKCDRCGKYVDTSDIPQIRGWDSEITRTVGTPRISMELCPDCFNALREFLLNKKEMEDACINCEFFSDSEYYADNTVTACAVSWGSCTKCQRNIISTSPHTEVPSWCPLKGDKE